MPAAYQTQIPSFLKSEGPFAVYDHSLKSLKQNQTFDVKTVVDHAQLAALRRYEKQIMELGRLREKEKAQFIANVDFDRMLNQEA
jgi:hypothetical protein